MACDTPYNKIHVTHYAKILALSFISLSCLFFPAAYK